MRNKLSQDGRRSRAERRQGQVTINGGTELFSERGERLGSSSLKLTERLPTVDVIIRVGGAALLAGAVSLHRPRSETHDSGWMKRFDIPVLLRSRMKERKKYGLRAPVVERGSAVRGTNLRRCGKIAGRNPRLIALPTVSAGRRQSRFQSRCCFHLAYLPAAEPRPLPAAQVESDSEVLFCERVTENTSHSVEFSVYAGHAATAGNS
jgi:hypothetical protein